MLEIFSLSLSLYNFKCKSAKFAVLASTRVSLVLRLEYIEGIEEYNYIVHFYLFVIMARMVEGCPYVRNVGKVRKGYGVSSQSRCLDSSVGAD